MAENQIKELIGKNLDQFQIIEMTEVYRINEDGVKTSALGYFKDQDVAAGFADAEPNWHKTRPAIVLTDGTVGYLMTEQEPIKIFDDEVELDIIKKRAIAKLSPAERKILGFE